MISPRLYHRDTGRLLKFIYFLHFLAGPKPIKLLQVPEINVDFVLLTWDVYADAGLPDYYLISYRNNNNKVVTYEPNVNSNQRTYKIENLIGDTPYTIRIMAVKANVNSSVVLQGLRTKLGKVNVSSSFFSMRLTRYGSKYSRMDQVKFVTDSL